MVFHIFNTIFIILFFFNCLIFVLRYDNMYYVLEPVCCKKQQKKVPDQLLVCEIGVLWRFWMVYKIDPGWSRSGESLGLIIYTISLESFRSFRGPLFRKPVTGQELLFLLFGKELLLAMSSRWICRNARKQVNVLIL